MNKTPYLTAAGEFYQLGWWPLPLPPNQKNSPPNGFTGATGRAVNDQDIIKYALDPNYGNIAIRLPKDIIGIDVDAYGDKNGGHTLAELERQVGPLPETVMATSRQDGVSGIRLYRLPAHFDEANCLSGFTGIEIIRFGHRYLVAPPSIHPSGNTYKWLNSHTNAEEPTPNPNNLPYLPDEWCRIISKHHDKTTTPITATATPPPPTTYPCKVAANWLQEATSELTRSGRSRHDVATSQVLKAARLLDFGHNLFNELETFSTIFINAITPDRDGGKRTAEHEWASIYNTALEKIALDPSTEPKHCCGPRQYDQLNPFNPLVPEPDAGENSTWHPLPLDDYIDGTHIAVLPTILSRVDGAKLLYAGKVHSIYGESESGKSWLCQWACADELNQGHSVIYIDFESDPLDIVLRLQLLGVPKDIIRTNFRYIRPEAPPHPADPAWTSLLAFNGTLVVIDGVTEALVMWQKASKENDDITQWMRHFPRAIARATGAAVVLVDHVAKDRETRGRFQLGGQAKLASIDGSAFLVEPRAAIAPGKTGKLSIRVTKDRPGSVRRIGGQWRATDRTQEVAVAILNAEQEGHIFVALCVPDSEEDLKESKRQTLIDNILHIVAERPNCSRGEVARALREAEVSFPETELSPTVHDLLASGELINNGTAGQWKLAMPIYKSDEEGGESRVETAS